MTFCFTVWGKVQ